MSDAAKQVQAECGVNTDGVSACSVMFDGTWHKRGHSSMHGVVSAISVDNVKVLDVDVSSTFCMLCRQRESWDKQSS